jgi:hypothetical protein
MHRCPGDKCKHVHATTLTYTEMKTKTVQGGVCYPSCLAGINGGQFRSQKQEVRSQRKKAEVKSEAN